MSKRINVRSNSYYLDQRLLDSASSKSDFVDVVKATNSYIRAVEQHGFIKTKSYSYD
jgi:hypothetical protein